MELKDTQERSILEAAAAGEHGDVFEAVLTAVGKYFLKEEVRHLVLRSASYLMAQKRCIQLVRPRPTSDFDSFCASTLSLVVRVVKDIPSICQGIKQSWEE